MCCDVPVTLVLWMVTFLGYMVQYMLLTNLNIAMTDMNQGTRVNNSQNINATSDEKNGKFSWNQSEEGLLLSAVFWFLWTSHLVGGTLSHKFGAKKVVTFSILTSSCLCLLIPSATFVHWQLLFVIRVIQGFILGLAFPSIMSVIPYWIADREKGKFLTCFLGISFGSGTTYFISGFIIDMYSWQGIFYVTGAIGILWCAGWCYFMYDKPALHPRLTDAERQAIRVKTNKKISIENLTRTRRVPWKYILTSGLVYISALAQFGVLWVIFIMIIYAPKYVKFFHHLNSVQTGVISSVPHFIRVLFSIIYAIFTDKIVAKKILSKTNARKLGTIFSHIIPGLSIIALALYGENFTVAVLSINLSIILSGSLVSSVVAGTSDISPTYGGVIMGLCGTLSHTTGFVIPLFVGYVTLNNDTIGQWQMIFFISAGISIVTGLLFLLFWSSDLQKWDAHYNTVADQILNPLDADAEFKLKLNDA